MANCERGGYIRAAKMGPQSWERDSRMTRGPMDAPVSQRPGLKPVGERPGQTEALRQTSGQTINREPIIRSGGGQPLGGVSW